MNSNRVLPRRIASTTLLFASLAVSAAPLVYEGQLMDAGQPANGRYDLRLTPHRDATSAMPLAPPVTFEDVEVVDGKFRVEGDFGIAPGTAAEPWLEVAVRDGHVIAGFSVIGGRQQAKLTSVIGQCWSSTGDEGSNPATNFLGTIDAQPLVLRVQNQQVARYEPSTVLFNSAPITANVIAGSAANAVTSIARGATISGGGNPASDAEPLLTGEGPNRVTDSYVTVAGGTANRAGNDVGTTFDAAGAAVGGGMGNAASGFFSTVAGGRRNIAAYTESTVTGGFFNCAGGARSWAGGSQAKVRAGTTPGSACDNEAPSPNSGDANGDEGTFAWADSGNRNFVSTGPDQFLVRSTGGMVLQPQIGTETDARKPRTQFNVVTGSSGVNPELDFRSNTSAVFEQATHNFLRVLAPSTFERGVLFGDETHTAAAGVLYDGINMSFRVGANQTRMTLASSGALTLNSATAIKTGGGTWDAPSDARLKSNVRDLDGALDALLRLRGVSFEYTRPDAGLHPAGTQVGFVAQEVQKVFPDWVGRSSDGYLTVGTRGFEALTVEALRELVVAHELGEEHHTASMRELQGRAEALAAENATMRADQARLRSELVHMAQRLERLERAGRN